MKNLAVLVSGGGSNMQSIADSAKSGGLKGLAKVVLVISNNPEAYALERAKNENIKSVCVERKNYADAFSFNEAILKNLEESKIDIVCLAGYMTIVGADIIGKYKGKILNIHPALLPKFGGKGMYGRRVHEAVIEAKEKKSGATVHFADENYDTGKIIMRQEVPVFDGDTPELLAARVLETEHKIYPLAIKKVIENLDKEV
jgi:phosphoribosylglycinamide formyltransferase-1